MTFKKDGGFTTKGVHPAWNPVSKKEGVKIRQVFRHVLSDKRFLGQQLQPRHGSILLGLKPSTQIIQIRGDKRHTTPDKWSKLFEVKDTFDDDLDAAVDRIVRNEMQIRNKLTNLDASDKLIDLTEEQFTELLSNFDPTYENFTNIVSNLMQSPHSLEFVKCAIESWYFTGHHHNENTIFNYCDKYYEKIESNKRFYSIVRHLNLRSKDYDGFRDTIKLSYLTHEQFVRLMNSMNIGKRYNDKGS